jgi:hypothetical protein
VSGTGTITLDGTYGGTAVDGKITIDGLLGIVIYSVVGTQVGT